MGLRTRTASFCFLKSIEIKTRKLGLVGTKQTILNSINLLLSSCKFSNVVVNIVPDKYDVMMRYEVSFAESTNFLRRTF